jgi:mono/diheme cytochrome c family protein
LKGFVLGILAAIVIGAGGAYLVLRSGVIPAAADVKPGRLEIWAAKTSLHATLDREAPKGPNPVPLSDDNLIAGIRLYDQHCAVCHGGAKGKASVPPIAKGENPAPPQLASEGVEDDPEGVTFWKVKHGIRWTGMPAWEKTLSDQQIWTLALFLKHMDKLPPATEQVWEKVVP